MFVHFEYLCMLFYSSFMFVVVSFLIIFDLYYIYFELVFNIYIYIYIYLFTCFPLSLFPYFVICLYIFMFHMLLVVNIVI